MDDIDKFIELNRLDKSWQELFKNDDTIDCLEEIGCNMDSSLNDIFSAIKEKFDYKIYVDDSVIYEYKEAYFLKLAKSLYNDAKKQPNIINRKRKKLKAIILDIDGTLGNCNHRLHYLRQEKKDYKTFSSDSEMIKDSINHWCSNIISKFKNTHKIILVSGRNEYSRKITLEWLNKNDIYHDYLFMRKDNDYRKSPIVKKEIYETEINNQYDVLFAIEDDAMAVQMYRELGIVCLQCDENNY